MSDSFRNIPLHSLPGEQSPVVLRNIEHKNPYDFTTEHRHTYFEIFFFKKGGGKQLIDFKESRVFSNSCYIVFPHQIHLLKRAATSNGLLVQFSEEVITSTQVLTLLQQHFHGGNPEVFFEKNKEKISKVEPLLELMFDTLKTDKTSAVGISVLLVQALILLLFDLKDASTSVVLTDDHKLLFEFQELLDQQYTTNHTVGKYASLLNTNEKKLAAVTKKNLGLSPLQVIHNRLLLEAKRLLIFQTNSHKEIAFQLGFDSPSSFSLFIKNKTGLNPSELVTQLAKIHK